MKIIVRHNGIMCIILRDITRIKIHPGVIISYASLYSKNGYVCGVFECNGLTYECSLEG